ncbi:hypothetical protein Q1695_004071 [Nippostrongylus brasiliensis]|nr:hypothetical protein Q1695_004071 [Nippostrongylus brasiliensis]
MVTEVCREYHLPLVLTFVDYKKAFDSVETNAILSACSTSVQLFRHPINILIEKGVRRGDTISPKLFPAALQWVMKSLDWDEKGMRVDGKFLLNLRFFVIFAKNTTEAETMLRELDEAGRKIGLRINRKKTPFMKNSFCDGGHIELDGSPIAETKSYAYLGRSMNMDNDMKEELIRRRRAAW